MSGLECIGCEKAVVFVDTAIGADGDANDKHIVPELS